MGRVGLELYYIYIYIYIIYIYLLVVEWNLPLIQQPVGKGHIWIYWF
jgi:hypothetical protein